MPFRTIVNHGEKPQYYVENMNAPIISKEDFNAVQKLLQNASNKSTSKHHDYALTGKIICECGKTYKPITINAKHYWGCPTHNNDSAKCSSRRIPEKDIYEAFINMINKLRNNCKQILPTAIAQTEKMQMKSEKTAFRIKEIDREIAELNGKHLVIARLNTKGIMRAAEYTEQSSKITNKTNALRRERRQLLNEQDENSVLSRLRRLNDVFSMQKEPLTEFNEMLFENIVQQITVPTNTQICFKLLGGLQIRESVPEQRRCSQV